jgi:hypothetical protein
MRWTPELVFMATWFFSGLTGLAAEKIREPDRVIPLWTGIAFFIVYGGLGSGFGMVGYNYLGGKDHPLAIIGWGQLVGMRVISIKKLLAKMVSNSVHKD